MQRDTISTQFFPSGSLKCASQNDLLKPWSSQSTGKQIWCRPSAPENESPVTLDVSPLPGTSEAISLLQVDGGETLQTRISRAAFAVEWRHVLTVRYYVKTCEGIWKICEDMKVLVRICGRKRQLLCLFHESRHNRSSDHNFRREFLRWWYWLTASWRHPLRVQTVQSGMIVGHQNPYTDYMRMDGTQLLSLRESEADAEAEQATYRRDSRPQACHLSFHASSSRAWESYRNAMHNFTLHDKIQQVSAISMIQHMTFHCARGFQHSQHFCCPYWVSNSRTTFAAQLLHWCMKGKNDLRQMDRAWSNKNQRSEILKSSNNQLDG